MAFAPHFIDAGHLFDPGPRPFRDASFDRLHHRRCSCLLVGYPFPLGHRKSAGVGPAREPNRHSYCIQAGYVTDPGYPVAPIKRVVGVAIAQCIDKTQLRTPQPNPRLLTGRVVRGSIIRVRIEQRPDRILYRLVSRHTAGVRLRAVDRCVKRKRGVAKGRAGIDRLR